MELSGNELQTSLMTEVPHVLSKANLESRKENPQKLTQLSSKISFDVRSVALQLEDLIQDTSWEKGQHKKTSP